MRFETVEETRVTRVSMGRCEHKLMGPLARLTTNTRYSILTT